MKVAVFSAKEFDRRFLDAANRQSGHALLYLEVGLDAATAPLARGCEAVCLFANDRADAAAIQALAAAGVRLIALRASGYDNVDLSAAARCGIQVARVPAYSPHAVAEHSFALLLSLVRKVYRGYDRVRRRNFSLDGLIGFDLADKTIGIVGTGHIGSVAARIARGFGMEVLATDPVRNADCCGILEYVPLDELFARSDIICLHCSLNESTFHLVDAERLAAMKPGAVVVNTSRGAVIDTGAAIDALEKGHLGGLAIDVYEHEGPLFFKDRSQEPATDSQFQRLLDFDNVLITGHQGFFTSEALTNIAATTIANLDAFAGTGRPVYQVTSTQRSERPSLASA